MARSTIEESIEFDKTLGNTIKSEYEYITWGFSGDISAIGRSEKRLRKLERGKRVFGVTVKNERGIQREREKLASLWANLRDRANRVAFILERDTVPMTATVSR